MTLLERPRSETAARIPADGARRRGAGTGAPSAVLDAVALLLMVAAAAAPLAEAFRTQEWLVAGLLLAAGALAVGTVARALVPGRATAAAHLIPILAALAGALALVTAFLTPGKGFAVIVPTAGSLGALDDRLAEGWAQVLVGVAPMTESPETVVLLAAAVLLVALLAFAPVAVDAPAVAGVPPLLLWIMPELSIGAATSIPAFLVGAAAWLLLIARPARPDGRRLTAAAAVAGVLALALALLVAPATPRSPAEPGLDPLAGLFDAVGIDQTVALGERLRDSTGAVVLTYVSDDPQYLRVLLLDDFTGSTWVADDPVGGDVAPDEFRELVRGQEAVETEIAVGALRSSSLPIPIGTVAVAGLPGDWRWASDFAMIAGGNADGLEYTATSLTRPDPGVALGIGVPFGGQASAADTELPADRPAQIDALAEEVTRDAADDYERALALQQWLRVDGGFAYSVDAPVEGGFDGSGLDALAGFLEVREGYCVHFASAMAVMARTLGIPSRIAIGFAPGEAGASSDGRTAWEVTGQDLHAWPELWFEGVGWVPFEPTPGLGLAAADPLEGGEVEEESAATAPSAAPTAAPESGQEQDPGFEAGGTDPAAAAGPSAVPLAVLAGVLLLLAVPGLARAALRRRRLRRGATAEQRWRELVNTAVDHGIPIEPEDTPRAVAAELAETLPSVAAGIIRLRDEAERRRYGPPAGDGADEATSPAALRGVLAAICERSGPAGTVRAAVAPRSLISLIGTALTRYAGGS